MRHDENRRISVIVRSASPDRLRLLNETLFSLATQDWHDIEVVVVLQNPAPAHLLSVEASVEGQPWHPASSCRIVPVEVPQGVDGRAILLTEGIRIASGRFAAFLDDDDVIYRHAYRTLIAALDRNVRAVMAMGQTRMAHISRVDDYYHVTAKGIVPFNLNQTRFDLLLGNFINIHCYVFDRSRLPDGICTFSTEAVPLEDYEFLLRLAAAGPFDFSCRDIPVCEYRIHETNSVGLGHNPSPQLARASEVLERMTRSHTIPMDRQDWLEVRAHMASLVPAQPYVPARTRKLVRAAERLNSFSDSVRDRLRALFRSGR